MITHSTNYYGQAARLAEIYAEWERFPAEIKTMVVDDGHCIEAGMTEREPDCLARIMVDVPFNFSGTINLAAALTTTPWMLHTEMDCHVTAEEAVELLKIAKRSDGREVVFLDMHLDCVRHQTVSNWPIPTALFWELGGYDEDFAGGYGHDDVFWYFKILAAEGIRHSHTPFTFHFAAGARSEIERDLARNHALIKTKNPRDTSCNNPLRFPFRLLRHRL
jgi:hypothetical protein